MPPPLEPWAWLDFKGHEMSRALALAALAFLLTVVLGRRLISALRAFKIGKQVRDDGPASHLVKTGTPTMGGLMILASIVILTVLFNLAGNLSMLLPLGVLLACGAIGIVDDRASLVGGGRKGLSMRSKLLALLPIATVAALALYGPLGLQSVYLPGLGKHEIGWVYVPLAIVFIVGFANAVNLTDGLDTLAGTTLQVAFLAYGIIAFLQGQHHVVTFCFTVVGALLGFLWFNAHPAQVFMGDTGALALGAVLAVSAFQTGQWLLLPLIGAVFVAVTLSVMLQVAYFKLTRGRRLFKMAPLHHHFELSGWAETQVTVRFWIVAVIVGFLGIALALW
ncbi:MAG: phospho-N-acetylmuramoyl-pentapeptide-transferase [Chloroflexi bacterium]|nr:phospho-N-acetylmuramoyl-pentapeptide-transferase [Chloroflexota bacterium]